MNINIPQTRLSTKLVWMAVAFLFVALAAVGMTLLESWKLEGGAAVINDMGSERMRSYRIAYLVSENQREPSAATRAALEEEISRLEHILTVIRRGDPARPLLLPRDADIVGEVEAIEHEWRMELRPLIRRIVAEAPGDTVLLRSRIERFVNRIDGVVLAVERNNSTHTAFLRSLQFGLIVLAVAGTVTLIYLMFLLVVRPLGRLNEGMASMAAGRFDTRLPIESRDEFGELAAGFNHMAGALQEVYATLEQRVSDKTRDLAAKNSELTALYDMATLLNQPASTEQLCRGFLSRLMALVAAQGGAVRLIEAKTQQIHLYVHEGLAAEFVRDEQCLAIGDCLCGTAAQQAISTVQFMPAVQQESQDFRCRRAGYQTVAVFTIRFGGEVLGIFNLYFSAPRTLTPGQQQMVEALGHHLGVAIENQRLISRVKEIAISEERNLLAQELHDSIAQSLAFLNLQAQMLDDALQREDMADARELLAQIRAGTQESYDDVRELLVHFRTRIDEGDISLTIRKALARFEAQTGITASFSESGGGVPLPIDRQLQVLHILQEALSNVRKHAGANLVEVTLDRDPACTLRVRDDGRGFDAAAASAQAGDGHIGLRIMRERAQRIGGELRVESAANSGTVVQLALPAIEVEAA